MLFIIFGIAVFSIFNVLGFLFVRKASIYVPMEKKMELSSLYSELNKYFVSAIVVYAVLVLFILKHFQMGILAIVSWYYILSLAGLGLLGYWLYIEMDKRKYNIIAIKFMIISSALKNLGFISIILGISIYINKLR